MSKNDSLNSLLEVIDRLTGPEGCPWDKEQNPLTLADYIIEESHELVAAIRDGDNSAVREELGDVFFLLLFITQYFEKEGVFTLADVLEENMAKMIRRHPHVFANCHFKNMAEQLGAWEKIKKEEHVDAGRPTGMFSSLPQSLPPLVKAYRIHSKAARVGFTWPEDEEVEQQVESEWLEFLDACQNGDSLQQKHEFGDILFSLVELGRRKGIKASEALDFADRRFIRRFTRMEELAREKGVELSDITLDEKDELWNLAKQDENKSDQ